jgi:DNA-binding response OmpR family regulator
MQSKILLLEDDVTLSDTIKQFLTHINYDVSQAFDALEAQDLLYEQHFDLMLLDIKVPYQNGFDLLKELRDKGNNTPAIFITSLHSVENVTRGFDAGCDDYIRKPFALKELKVRIESLLKRQFGSYSETIKISETLQFDPSNLVLLKEEKEIKLKNKEVKLLKLFLTHQNKIINKSEIFEALWDYDEEANDGSLRTYIKILRSHLGKESIETIKNIGYRYVSE